MGPLFEEFVIMIQFTVQMEFYVFLLLSFGKFFQYQDCVIKQAM